MKYTLIFISVFFSKNLQAQDTIINFHDSIFLPIEYNFILKNEEKIKLQKDDNDCYYFFVFNNAMGACKFYKFNKNKILVISGNYKEATKFEDYVVHHFNPSNGEVETINYIRLVPLKHGIWKYYNDSTKLIRMVKYKNGKLINESDI